MQNMTNSVLISIKHITEKKLIEAWVIQRKMLELKAHKLP